MRIHTPTKPRLFARLRASVLATVAVLLCAASAQASHFRGASITWKKLASPANTVEITVTESWRSDFGTLGQSYAWGDGTGSFSTIGAPVVASGSDATGLYTILRKVVTHTYPSAGPYTVSTSGSARIAFINSNQTSWVLQSVVDLRNGNQGSPVISSPIVLQMIKGGLNNVPLSYADVDGDTVAFRMATTAESGITNIATAGGKTLAVSSSGVLTWDTSSTTVGQLYAVQVVASDNHPLSPSGVGTTKVYFDFMIQIVDGTLNRPPVASGNAGPFTAAIGVPFTNVITGTDPDGGNLTVTHLGLPNGATLSPVSGTTRVQPLAATFSWTPTIADADSSVGVTIVFTDPSGLTASKSFSISVPSNQPPVANAGPDQTVYDTDANDVPTIVGLNGGASYDPEGLPVTYSWTQVGGTPVVALTGANTATPSFTAPSLHIHPDGQPIPLDLTFRLSVYDGKSTRTDDIAVTVKHYNLKPTASAMAPASAPEGTTVTLDGSASSDPDQDPLSYTWTLLSEAPLTLAPNGTNSPTLDFTYGVVGPHSIPGELLEFTLTVSDGIDTATSSVVPVFIKNVNHAPTVDAGDDEAYFDNAGTITLDGAANDADGDSLSLFWTQVAGPAVALDDPTSPVPSFGAPAVSPEQGSVTLTFQLVANDSFGDTDTEALDSAPSTVNILVKHANRAPVADAGANKCVPEQTTVTLDGTGSYDPDQDALASYTWTQTGGIPVDVDTTNPAHPSFTAPDVGPTGETLTFQLVVADQPAAGSGVSLTSAPSTVTIAVKYVNRPPLANAGTPQTADEGNVVTLAGSGSDPDGNSFTYVWSQIGGPAITLSDATAATPSFTAPAVDRAGATLTFALKTTDEFNASSNIATTTVTVQNINHAPVADAGETQSVSEDTAVTLAGTAVDLDSEEQPLLTYAWTQTGGPSVTLSGADTQTPSFQAPLVTGNGDPLAKVSLKFRLTVNDPNNASSSDEVEVVVTNVDHSPIANAGGASIVGEATSVPLNGTLSNDPDGDTLSYAWVQTAGPTVTLANANTATPSFTAPFVNAAGTVLKFKLTVDDGFGGISSDIATVSVANTNNPPTLSNPQASLRTIWPPDHSMVKISILGIVDPNNNASIQITGVTQDEATNGLGDGDTAVDAIINPDGTVLVRSERGGKGNGRVYHIHFTAADFEGSVSGVVTVGVPHDKKGDLAIDGGELFDSTH